MKPNKYILLAVLLLCVSALAFGSGKTDKISSVIPVNTRCEYLINPKGLDELHPRFSWTLVARDTSAFGQGQTAYRIVVAATEALLNVNKGDVWDSGWVNAADMQHIVYQGKALTSDRTYFWKVCVKDEKGRVSAWSETARWTTGLFRSADWKAKWIGTDQIFDRSKQDCNIADPWLRKTFTLKTKPGKATVFVASVGFHEIYVNGKKVGNDIMAPSVTDHTKRARYVAYDIAPELKAGKNVIAIWLGTSWSIFSPYNSKDRPNTPMVIAQAAVYPVKSPGALTKPEVVIMTDESWKTHKSPNKLLGVWDFGKMGGELWDAREEMPEWNTLSCDETAWSQAICYQPKLILSAQKVEPNRVFDEIKPIAIAEKNDGTYRVDMGVNFAGWTEIKVKGNQGDRIEFLFSEREQNDMTFNNHSAFIIGVKGEGTFHNRFNYSSGRWITIKGLKYKPTRNDIKGWMVRTNYQDAAAFECSDSLQNWIYDRIKWTFQNLSIGGYIVDCPQRERLGYGGDAHATCETGMFNYHMAAFYTKWMEDWRDVQDVKTGMLPHTAPTYTGGGGPPWGGIVVALPWFIYQHEGDTRILEKNFELIKGWLSFLDLHTKDHMLVRFGGEWDFLGDWLWPGATAEGMNNDKPQTVFLNNCYRIFNLRTAAKIARILHKDEEALRWEKQAEISSAAIQAKFYNKDDHSYSDKSMANLAAALVGDVMPAGLKPLIMKRLENEILVVRKGHINVGITGGAMLFKVLRDAGRDDLIYSMTSQTDYPGWGYMKANGATTIWEMWEKDLPGHSLLHSSYLYPGAWYIDGVAGIRRDQEAPGFQRFIVRTPLLTETQMKWARAELQSPAGLIKTSWKRDNGELSMSINVPPNCTAVLQLRVEDAASLTAQSRYMKDLGIKNGFRCFELTPGHHRIKAGKT
ncbi:family 78 glycoside hydrolase catalytic domain [Pedobacter frigoris]|uniref:family 78 glycoside hydrolase catalytic domain n=1 Tax=Pedobacter frigoris TaxID=2571272 RepID=UPI0029316132|nr:family 78 glycoside hydrolase catalytic domain [Pedobacter frigoris]